MRQRAFLVLVLVGILAAHVSCGRNGSGQQQKGQAAVRAFVTLLPQEYIVRQVGGGHVSVQSLIGPGENPHTFEPSPRQMSSVAQADIYFLIDVPFERIIRGQIEAANPEMKMVSTTEGIELRMVEGHEAEGAAQHGHEHEGHVEAGSADEEGMKDPHVWLDPANVKVMARNVAEALVEIDGEHAADYEENLADFLERLDALDREIRGMTEGLQNRRFMVYHPAFGYFADAYDLEQIPVEIEGKQPTARTLSRVIQRAKDLDIKVIFVQEQFSRESAQVVAREIGGEVVALDPLSRTYVENMKKMARAFAGAMR